VARAENEAITPLNAACRAGDLGTVRGLLAGGASPDEPNPGDDSHDGTYAQGLRPLLSTLGQTWDPGAEDRLAILRRLLDAGADPNFVIEGNSARIHQDSLGGPLHFAVGGWWKESWKNPRAPRARRWINEDTRRLTQRNNTFVERAVRMLLDAGANPNSRRPGDGRSPLHLAGNRGSLVLTRLLLERGADVRITDDNGFTALTQVVVWGDNPELESFYDSYLTANRITITDPRWRDRRSDRFGRSLGGVLRVAAYLALPLAYAAGAIYLRESHFRDRPQDNWLGVGNAYLTVTAVSMIGAGAGGAYLASRGGRGGLGELGAALGGFWLGAVLVGLPAGILATYFGHVPRYFKDYRALYYLPPAAALGITTVVLAYKF
jgi:hypothetical protein